ncbi:tyrosine-type recombinase/integrase [uncultured Ilyobacter sp.]|uniref:tyrosine-type recombinase/integrase n=1 Tax=uncultured Ilyobacter sp. TaxID=544433 RepID=UPI0029C08011|nr:tyrosine-type recombinase/integrase [uncultured Ilyobacter sp.]
MNSFYEYMKKKYHSENTIKSLTYSVNIFLNWYEGELENIDPGVIGGYKEYLLKDRGVSVRTAASYFKGLKFFIRYLYQEYGQRTKVTVINEYGELVKINIPDLKYKINNIGYDKEISVKEVNRLLKVAKENRERDYILFLLLATTGLRVSEALSLNIKQLRKTIMEIESKGKVRTVILPPNIRNKIKKYIADRKIESQWVFHSIKKSENPLGRKQVHNLMKSYARKARVKKEKCFPHNLRHHYTVNEINMGTDLQTLADDLGHNGIETLKIYKERSLEEKRKRMEKLAKKYK